MYTDTEYDKMYASHECERRYVAFERDRMYTDQEYDIKYTASECEKKSVKPLGVKVTECTSPV